MNNKVIIPVLMISLVLGAATVRAQHHEQGEEMSEGKMVEAGNKICPVSGEKVGQMGETVQVEHNGKLYNLCCAMCKKDFLKDPERYSAIAEEEVKGMPSPETSQNAAQEEHDHNHE